MEGLDGVGDRDAGLVPEGDALGQGDLSLPPVAGEDGGEGQLDSLLGYRDERHRLGWVMV